LAQLRTGHCKDLTAYQNRVDNTKYDRCPRCQRLTEAEALHHWLSCAVTILKRQEIFRVDNITLGMMTKQPKLIMANAKETFEY
jgi:hypothetical protein